MADRDKEISDILVGIALVNHHSTDPKAKRRYYLREYLADRGAKMPVEMKANSIDSFFRILDALERVPQSDEKDAVRSIIESYILGNLHSMTGYCDILHQDDAFLPHERKPVRDLVETYKRRVGEYFARQKKD